MDHILDFLISMFADRVHELPYNCRSTVDHWAISINGNIPFFKYDLYMKINLDKIELGLVNC